MCDFSTPLPACYVYLLHLKRPACTTGMRPTEPAACICAGSSVHKAFVRFHVWPWNARRQGVWW
jgi:hypothetical protein